MMCDLADAKGNFLDVTLRVVLVKVHRDPAVERLLGHRTVARTINAGAERVMALGKSRALLKEVEEINWPTARDLMGFVRHAFGGQRGGELARRAAEQRQVEFEQDKE